MGWNGGVRPASVMQGKKFKQAMDSAFKELMGPEFAAQEDLDDLPAAEDDLCALPASQSGITAFCPPLDIQATNVVGRQQSFVDAWGYELVAREYRAPFRFRKRDDFKPPLMATAARASASFPGAFEPFE